MKSKSNDDYIFISICITSIILIFGIILYKCFFFNSISISSCYIYENLHIYCPGCGCTRAFLSLLNFDIISSIYYNPIIVYSMVVISLYLITQSIDRILKHDKYFMPYSNIYIYIGISIIFVNCIVRNFLLLFYNISI